MVGAGTVEPMTRWTDSPPSRGGAVIRERGDDDSRVFTVRTAGIRARLAGAVLVVLSATACTGSDAPTSPGPDPIPALVADQAVPVPTETGPPPADLPVVEAKRGPLPDRAAPMPWRRVLDGADRVVAHYQAALGCYGPQGFYVEYTDTRVVLTPIAVDGRAAEVCPAIAYVPTVAEVRLPEPVGDREVVTPPGAQGFLAVLDETRPDRSR